MDPVARRVIQAKGSEQGNVTVLRHLMEVKGASDLIAGKQHVILKDVQVSNVTYYSINSICIIIKEKFYKQLQIRSYKQIFFLQNAVTDIRLVNHISYVVSVAMTQIS